MKRAICISLTSMVILLCFWVGYGIIHTNRAIYAFQRGDWIQASAHATRAKRVAASLDTLSLYQQSDIRAWVLGLDIIRSTPEAVAEFQTSISTSDSQPETQANISMLPTYFNLLKELNGHLAQTKIIAIIAPEKTVTLQTFLADFEIVHQSVLTGRHTYLVIFQNTDELRATGGFIGSYALVTLNNGKLEKLEIQDIYVPDGQFTGFVTAPPGVQEYLSSGRGLRLPDANWWPDFPTSAKQVLAYFALGKESHIDGVIALNLEVAESVLAVTGDVFVPDYQMTIDQDNLADALRSGRDEFFPGSITKQHLLESVFTQLKLRLAELSPEQHQAVLDLLATSIDQKDIQFYANDEPLQQLLIRHNAAGVLTTHLPNPTDFYFTSVESNVGINKANRGVTREVDLNLTNQNGSVTIIFTNTNQTTTTQITRPDQSPHYVNYQRVYLNPDTTLERLAINGTEVTDWHEEIITTSTGEYLKQLGFLVTVPAQQSTTVSLSLSYPSLPAQPQIGIQKQAGQPSTHYRINYQNQTQEIWLTDDHTSTF